MSETAVADSIEGPEEIGSSQRADVIDISLARMSAILESAAPVYPIPPKVLQTLRVLDLQQRALMDGCVGGLGIDLSRYSVNFDIAKNQIICTPLETTGV